MLHMMRNGYTSATRLIDTAAQEIGARLPPRWRLLDREKSPAGRPPQDSLRRFDAVWEIQAPDGLSSDVIVEVQGETAGTYIRRTVRCPG